MWSARRSASLGAAEDDVEAPASAMAAMGAPDGGDPRRVARCREPVVDRGPDPPSLDGRLAWPLMAGDQQHDAVAGGDRLLQDGVDRAPGTVEIMAVQVEDSVGGD